jgi:quercetin 2,3-dioxygenase
MDQQETTEDIATTPHIQIHKAEERGMSKESWLESRHSFSFNHWHRLDRMGFGALRVLNDDIIAPGEGFDTHSHQNMEIVTIVLNGALKHKDSTGGHGLITPGEVQRMSAGTGVLHSEFNASNTDPVELLQIWILPKQDGIPPSYEQKRFDFKDNRLQCVVDGERKDGALYIHRSATLSLGKLTRGTVLEHPLQKKGAYVFLISGMLEVEGRTLSPKDAAAITDARKITLKAHEPSHVLVIES